MRVSLDAGAVTDLDQNRGIGVYAEQIIRRLPKLVKVVTEQPEIIHYLAFKLFAPQLWRGDVPVMVTVHDLIPLKYPKAYPPGIRGRLKWWRQKQQLQQVDGIITDSNASKQDIISFTGVPAEKISTVYLAADEIFQPIEAENKYKLPEKFVLYVGDLNWNKNVVCLTRLCLKLDYPLVVVGRQATEANYDQIHPETTELVKFQRLAKVQPQKIIRLGTVPAADLAAIYSLATVYVQPSRDEGFGLPVLEALSCGCPVLSSGSGSLPEITGTAALKFNPANMRRLWNKADLRRQLSQAGLIQAKKFSWDKTVRETVKVYETVIDNRFNR